MSTLGQAVGRVRSLVQRAGVYSATIFPWTAVAGRVAAPLEPR